MITSKESVFLNEKIAKKLFKNEKYGKILSAKVISDVLDLSYEEVYNNISLSTEEIAFSALTVNSTADAIYYNDKIYFDIELNFYNNESKPKQLDSYIFQLYLGQLHTYKNYYKIKKIIQISIDAYDYFGFNEFMYNVYFMEEKYKVIENENIHKIHLNLDYLHKIDYNEIVNGKNKLMKDLYFLTSNDKERINDVYGKDKLMKEIIDEAKQIAGIEKMDLYLTDEEMLKQEEEHYYELGMTDGIKKVVFKMLKDNVPFETISKYTNLSFQEIDQIQEDQK
jgi:predicted transposase/invertase (TIGR01784 family)